MKPAFALNLDHDRITLLHREGGEWARVGDVGLDDPDMEKSLRVLRRRALALAPEGITCKVILPASQILYTTLAAPGPDTRSRKAQIRAALEGMTPYTVDELVYDWSGTGASVQVAVVARETLDEAETFAAEHRFGPVSFVSIPDPARFAGEPFFGITQVASKILPDDDRVMRDNDPVRLPFPVADGAEDTPAETAPVTDPVDASPQGGQSPDTPTGGTGDAAPPAFAEAALPFDPAPGPAETRARAGRLTLIATDDGSDDQADVVLPVDTGPRRGKKRGRRKNQRKAALLIAGASDDTDGDATERPTKGLAEDTSDGSAQDDAQDEAVPFSSRRASGPVAPPEIESAEDAADLASAAAPTAADTPEPYVRPLDLEHHPVGMTAPIAPDDPDDGDRKTAGQRPPALTAMAGAERAARSAALSAAQTLTGTVGKRPVAVALLAAVVILFVVIFAWSVVFRGDAPVSTENSAADAGPPAPAAVGMAQPGEQARADLAPAIKTPPAPAVSSSAPGVPGFAAAPGSADQPPEPAEAALPRPGPFVDQRPASAAGGATTDALPTDGLRTAGLRALVPPLSPIDFVAQPLQTRLSAFAPGMLPAPPAQSPETIAGTIPAAAPDPVIVPGLLIGSAQRLVPGPAGNADRPPLVQTLPLPARDAVVLREGVEASPPPVAGAKVAALVPAEQPKGVSEGAAAVALTDPEPDSAATTGGAAANPALAGFRPRARPESLVVAAAAAEKAAAKTAEKVAAAKAKADANDAILAALRPRARPKALAADVAADLAAEAAARAAAASSAASAAAIASSVRPDSRPRTLAAVVPTPPQVSEQSGPQDDDEPDVVSVAPRIPTRASVAAQATIENALALRDINLIGVYGDSSNRRALVRMPNGKMMRVRVGDKIDGGQVATIDKARLIYVKGGRNHVLDMPKG